MTEFAILHRGPRDGELVEVSKSSREYWRGTMDRPWLYERTQERDGNGRVLFVFTGYCEQSCGK